MRLEIEQDSIEKKPLYKQALDKKKHLMSKQMFIFAENDEPACSPRDFLNSTPYFSDAIYSPKKGGDECLPSCFRREYFTKITEAQIDPGAILRYANVTGTNKLGDPE